MLEYKNDRTEKLVSEWDCELESVKAIVIVSNIEDLQNLRGYLYAVSKDRSSFDELCELSNDLRTRGTQNIIVGMYDGGVAIGVQHTI